MRQSRRLLLLAFAGPWLWGLSGAVWADLLVWPVSSLTKVLPAQPAPTPLPTAQFVEGVRNEWESFQIVLRAQGQPAVNVRVEVGDLRGPGGALLTPTAFELRRVGQVTVRTPSTAKSHAGAWPDPLPPLRQPFGISPDEGSVALWITVRLERGLPAGRYTGALTVSWSAGRSRNQREVKLIVQVHDAELPDGTGPFHVWCDQDPQQILSAHAVTPAETGRAQLLLTAYANWQAARRLPPSRPPMPLERPAAARWLETSGLSLFRLPAGGPGELPPRLPRELVSQGYDARSVALLPNTLSGDLSHHASLLRDRHPSAQVLCLSRPDEAALDQADVWGVAPTELSLPETVEAKALGTRLWWVLPNDGQPTTPSLLLDEAAAPLRALGWLQALYRVEGLWIRHATNWGAGGRRAGNDVWRDPETVPGQNGAGYLLYPGSGVGLDEPVSSLRFELLRDGLEDLLTLDLLEKALDDRAVALGAAGYRFGRERVRELVLGLAPALFDSQPTGALLEKRRHECLTDLAGASADPPLLVRLEPADAGHLLYPGEGVFLHGVTSPEATVQINDHPLRPDAGGLFRARAYPVLGTNQFVIRACVGEQCTELRRQCVVVEDPQLGQLEKTLAEAESSGLPLPEAKSTLQLLRRGVREGTYTRDEARRAGALLTEARRKLARKRLALQPGPNGQPPAQGSAQEKVLRMARNLERRGLYGEALRTLAAADKLARRDLDAPCRVEAGTFFGKVGFRITNGWLSLIVWRQGGRLVDLRVLGVPLLGQSNLSAVPDNEAPPLSLDLGGFEDAELGHNQRALVNWNLAVIEEFDERLTLAARTYLHGRDLKLERRLTVKRGSPSLLLTYRVFNENSGPIPFQWRARLTGGVGFGTAGEAGDPTHDSLWIPGAGGNAFEQSCLEGAARQVLMPASDRVALFDATLGLGLAIRYDRSLFSLRLIRQSSPPEYRLETVSGGDNAPVTIDPGDLLHFQLELLPLLGVDSGEAVTAAVAAL